MVKLDTDVKSAEVYINGNYTGTGKQLKTMMMTPGDSTLNTFSFGIEVNIVSLMKKPSPQ